MTTPATSETTSERPAPKSNRRELCIGAGVLVAVCALSYWWWGYTKEVVPPPNAGLVVDEKELDFGEQWEDRAFPWKFTIHNPTGKDVTIAGFSNSCWCVAVKPESVTISTGKTAQVFATVDLSAPFLKQPAGQSSSRRTFEAELEPIIRDGAGVPNFASCPRASWTIRGHVRRRVTFDVPSLHFGAKAVCAQEAIARKTLVTVHVPTKALQAHIKPAVASVRTAKINENQFELWVSPRTDRPPGRFRGNLTLVLVDDKGVAVEAGWLALEGELLAENRPIPARLILPATKVAEIAEGMFLLQMPEGDPLTVGSITAHAPNVHIEQATVPGIATGRAFAVRLKVDRAGDISTMVHFTVRRPRQDARVYPMEVFCRGLPNGSP